MILDGVDLLSRATPVAPLLRALEGDPCSYCGRAPGEGAPQTRSTRPSRQGLDHIVPRSDGGADDWTNFTACCHSCNSSKHTTSLLGPLGWLRAKTALPPGPGRMVEEIVDLGGLSDLAELWDRRLCTAWRAV